MRPRLLDLFCGAGGAAMGYHRAGFDVVGVDINPQPHYPFEFHQGDALEYVRALTEWADGRMRWNVFAPSFDAIHASPPCQHYSKMSDCRPGLAQTYPDLVAPTRELLKATGLPYVIENVYGSPLENWVQICGSGLGMPLQRHRWFEANFPLWGVPCAHGQNKWNPDYGHATGRKRRRVPVIGEWRIKKELQDEAMGIDWMTLEELSEAIPPAYSFFIGQQLIRHLGYDADDLRRDYELSHTTGTFVGPGQNRDSLLSTDDLSDNGFSASSDLSMCSETFASFHRSGTGQDVLD